MKSVSGYSKNDEAARYTEAANQERLAESTIQQLVEWKMSDLDPRLDANSLQRIENA